MEGMSETLVELWGQVGVVLDLEDAAGDVRKSQKNRGLVLSSTLLFLLKVFLHCMNWALFKALQALHRRKLSTVDTTSL